MNQLLTMSAVEIAQKIKRGELSPVEVLEVHIKRIQEVNPLINAVVVERFEEAKKEAKQAEEKLAKDKSNLPPLFGVPCTIKDCFAINGLPWAVGVWARKNLIADKDATVVKRIKQAGAIIMGKTNVPEAAMWCETYNQVYGRTKNPYDLRRGVGGSSGGEGAIIAGGASPFGIGSDIGGSIRYPSAFNGIAGHKPTGRLVPSTGHWPLILEPLDKYGVYGPMARRVSDLAYLLPIIAGPDGEDKSVQPKEIKSMEAVDRAKLKVFYFDSNGQARANAEVRKAINMAVGGLAGLKIPVEFFKPKELKYSLQIWQAGMSLNPTPFIKNLAGEEPISLFKEFFRLILRRSKITFPALGTAMIEKPGQFFKSMNQKSLRIAQELQRKIEEKLGDNGVLICPVFSTPAPKHTWIWLDFLGIGYSGVINILELPSTIIPIYHREDGVPVSVQIVGKRFNDHLTMAVAKILEEIFGGWKPIEQVGRKA